MHTEKSDARFQTTPKAIAPTLSEVQHAYAVQFSLKGALRRQGHDAVTLEKRESHSSSSYKTALEHIAPPLRQTSSYGDVLSPHSCGTCAQRHNHGITGILIAAAALQTSS